ncbi:homoserine kinase [Peptostreptococcus faecalis]|uniref:homoserine kinase n=1 Tax=Peptostreptococcus faecalis TaxID=2045015 RepID=UPI000C7C102C|nr:homoserine kinase [Peptostreptococcus faecalis]
MFKVLVPATTANLGPGFDSLGMALTKYSTYECELNDNIDIQIEGIEKEKLNVENNLVVNSMNKLFDYVGKYPTGYTLKINNGIPMARGLGSSASAIVGGLIVANELVGNPLGKEELLNLATEIEGHPDNVAPALLGELILSTKTSDGKVIYRSIKPFEDLRCVVFIPEYEVSTKDSREVLPEYISMEDTVHNSSHLGLLIMGFLTGDKELIGITMDDRIHEPYRKVLIKKFDEFKKAALDAGAFAFSLSGSGSTIIAYCSESESNMVCEAMQNLANKSNIAGVASVLEPCVNGPIYERGD